jgi:hypothetical protein
VIFLLIVGVLIWRCLGTGGQAMLRMMGLPEDQMDRMPAGSMES